MSTVARLELLDQGRTAPRGDVQPLLDGSQRRADPLGQDDVRDVSRGMAAPQVVGQTTRAAPQVPGSIMAMPRGPATSGAGHQS
jgi:hypothetical protein